VHWKKEAYHFFCNWRKKDKKIFKPQGRHFFATPIFFFLALARHKLIQLTLWDHEYGLMHRAAACSCLSLTAPNSSKDGQAELIWVAGQTDMIYLKYQPDLVLVKFVDTTNDVTH